MNKRITSPPAKFCRLPDKAIPTATPAEANNAAKLVVDEHRPAVDVARELDINPKSLYSWVRQYRSGLLQASLDGEDSVSAEQAEIARLRSELQKSRAEVLLLKKFAAYLSKNGLQ